MSKTKAKSVAEALRIKRANSLPALKPSKKREKNGCYVERTRQQAADPEPMRTALTARAKHSGLNPAKKADLEKAKAEIYGDPHGQALAATLSASEAARLHKVWCDLTEAEETRKRLKIGVKQGMDSYARELVRDPVDTEGTSSPDTRTEDERVEAATRRWMVWEARLYMLDPAHQRVIELQRDKTGAPVWVTGLKKVKVGSGEAATEVERMVGSVTPAGMAFVSAIGALADVVEREGRQ